MKTSEGMVSESPVEVWSVKTSGGVVSERPVEVWSVEGQWRCGQ